MEDTSLMPAILIDLDGTLALLNGRDPWDASTCDRDCLNEPVAEMVKCYQLAHPDHQTILITSRPSRHRGPTDAFLRANNIQWHLLFMREDSNMTPCAFYKWWVYKHYIEESYKVQAVFEDDPTVCRMWAQLGLPLFRVGDPDTII